MDEKKIAFIICVNDLWYYEECVRYIQELCVPDTYTVDIMCIQEADSMAEGYNGGCEASDAKYKVYLHQDTFITNRNYIYDILDIFENSRIGMIGVVGATELSDPIHWDIGNMAFYNPQLAQDMERLKQDAMQKWMPVKVAGKYLLATQYDIPWQEMDDGWNNYNIMQSLNMRTLKHNMMKSLLHNRMLQQICLRLRMNLTNVLLMKKLRKKQWKMLLQMR